MRKADSTSWPTDSASLAVNDSLVIGPSSGGWSISCSAPLPQRDWGARPPMTTTGEPLKWAVAMPLTPLVMPGPAVSTASPGLLVSLAVASAANTALCSWRTSRMRMSSCTAPS